MTGGGSGGHITPILAVASQLKKLRPEARIVYIGQKGDSLGDVVTADPNIDVFFNVSAGKFRRYHGEGLKQLFDIKTNLLNLRDVFRIMAGFLQSRRLLKKLQPEIVFTRGGYVSVPVALAATTRHIPFVTHDSDAIPSLANRLIARWAIKHAVALPEEVYKMYPRDKTVTVGVPVTDNYRLVTPGMKAKFRQQIGLDTGAKLLFIIGGGLGAQRVNAAVATGAADLLKQLPDLQIVHGAGRANEADVKARYQQLLPPAEQGRVEVKGFLNNVFLYSGAADVIITRAGATNLAEFAVQGKACIVVPNPLLTGGHQTKNAAYLQAQQAVELVNEAELKADPHVLGAKVAELLKDPARQAQLGKNFRAFGHPDAARELAELIIKEADAASP